MRNPFEMYLQQESSQINLAQAAQPAKPASTQYQFEFENFNVPMTDSGPVFAVDDVSHVAADIGSSETGPTDQHGDPPLLEDLGINLESIKQRVLLSVTLKQPSAKSLQQVDLTGPITIALILAFELMLSGQMHFGDIYGATISGTTVLYFLMNFMSETETVMPLYNTMSVLGYALTPMLVLGFIHIFISLQGVLGLVLGTLAAGWSTTGATNFFQVTLALRNKKWLVAYPVFLFYMTFVLITIF